MKKVLKKTIAYLCALCLITAGGCQSGLPEEEITVYMPDGAPALALAKLMHEDKADDGVTYRVVRAELIASKVTNKTESDNADLCIMPVTAAAKLLGTGEKYKMLGAVTHGNLYLISKTQTELTEGNLSSLIGKKVGVLQMNNVPGLTFKSVLNKHGVACQEMTNEGTMSEDKVNLMAISGAEAVGTIEADYFLLAEPAVGAKIKNGYSIVGDLQKLYGGENGYTQAVLVAKTDFVAENEAWVKDFIEDVEEAADWLSVATGEQLVSTVTAHLEDKSSATTLKEPMLTKEVLSRCGVWYTPAKECKEETDELLQKLLTVKGDATAIPNAEFYWMK